MQRLVMPDFLLEASFSRQTARCEDLADRFLLRGRPSEIYASRNFFDTGSSEGPNYCFYSSTLASARPVKIVVACVRSIGIGVGRPTLHLP